MTDSNEAFARVLIGLAAAAVRKPTLRTWSAPERYPSQQAQSPAGWPRSAGFFVRAALASDIDPIKIIADDSRAELGFHTRDSFTEGVDRGEILVAVGS